jgi:23S rRNA pseudouridine2605 synthase
VAEVIGTVDRATLNRLRRPIVLEDGPVRAEQVHLVSATAERSMVRITLHEGRNRIVRRMLDSVGHPVRRLSRIAIGPVRLGDLKPGELRELDRTELGKLLDLVDR